MIREVFCRVSGLRLISQRLVTNKYRYTLDHSHYDILGHIIKGTHQSIRTALIRQDSMDSDSFESDSFDLANKLEIELSQRLYKNDLELMISMANRYSQSGLGYIFNENYRLKICRGQFVFAQEI